MRTLLALVVLVILAGGGYYLYSQQTPVTTTPTPTPTTNVNVNTPPNTPSTTSNNGVNIGVDGSVATGQTREIVVTNQGMTFNPKTLTAKKGERLKITYNNSGGTHDLKIEGYNVGTKVIQAGQSESFEFVADKTGSFEYYCSVGNHRAMGMVGTFTVTE